MRKTVRALALVLAARAPLASAAEPTPSAPAAQPAATQPAAAQPAATQPAAAQPAATQPVATQSAATPPAATPPAAGDGASGGLTPAGAADPTAGGSITRASLHHSPVSVAAPHAPLEIAATIAFPHLVRRAILVYRPLPGPGGATAPFMEVEFLRGSPGPYSARVPADRVGPPGLEYAIELELADGSRAPVFASREAPHRVFVPEDLMDLHERAALERLGGRRSVVSASMEYVDFGLSRDTTKASGEASDWYYRAEGAYTYRPLRTIDEFSVHVGAIRGRSPGNSRTVGINYAAPSLKLRVADPVRIEGELLASVTEVGFSAGAGGAIEVGDPYGSRLRVGFESIHIFGARYYSQVIMVASPRLRISPIVEATDMPHAQRFGVRLVGEVTYDLGEGISVAARGGYQSRDSTSGGASGGLTLGWAF